MMTSCKRSQPLHVIRGACYSCQIRHIVVVFAYRLLTPRYFSDMRNEILFLVKHTFIVPRKYNRLNSTSTTCVSYGRIYAFRHPLSDKQPAAVCKNHV